MDKYCIFHIPDYIQVNGQSGSQIRPRKMIEAFEKNGYKVDCVMGYGKNRKISINYIKKQINEGRNYDFIYSESSTMPTQLTEKHHLPIYPFLDFNFLKFCKLNGINVGLFYRDIYWKFPEYSQRVSGLKKKLAVKCYEYDVKQYEKILNKFFVPTNELLNHLNSDILKKIAVELPPGCINKQNILRSQKKNSINLFYVGGIQSHYSMNEVINCVSKMNNVKLTICCRKSEYDLSSLKSLCEKTNNIEVVHKNSNELQKYYEQSDIALCYFKNNVYMDMAVPIKMFEYLGNHIPIIATTGTAAGAFVRENNIGWEIPYGEEYLSVLLKNILENGNDFIECIPEVANQNTWEKRAEKVVSELSI